MTFSQPAPSGDKKIPFKERGRDLLDSLFLVHIQGYEAGIVTVNGVANAIRGDAVILDGALKGEFYGDALIFPKVLVNSLKKNLDGGQRIVLGRIGQGSPKPGQSPAWILKPWRVGDDKIAQDWMRANPTFGTAPVRVENGEDSDPGAEVRDKVASMMTDFNLFKADAERFAQAGLTASDLTLVQSIPNWKSLPVEAVRQIVASQAAHESDEPPF